MKENEADGRETVLQVANRSLVRCSLCLGIKFKWNLAARFCVSPQTVGNAPRSLPREQRRWLAGVQGAAMSPLVARAAGSPFNRRLIEGEMDSVSVGSMGGGGAAGRAGSSAADRTDDADLRRLFLVNAEARVTRGGGWKPEVGGVCFFLTQRSR